jgi:hypothetical protein
VRDVVTITEGPLCPRCELQLSYQATLGAPGVGTSWACSNEHTMIRVGSTLYDPTQIDDNSEPPWVLDPGDCI